MGVYKAPVISNRYKKVLNHFNNKSKSTVLDGKFGTNDHTINQNGTINLQFTTSAALVLNNKPNQPVQLLPISTEKDHIKEQE